MQDDDRPQKPAGVHDPARLGATSAAGRARANLTPRRARFVAEYSVDLNATQAALRAGYSKKTAYSQGQRLLKNVEVSSPVAAAQARQLAALELTATCVLAELRRVAFSDVGELFDDLRRPLPVSAMPERARHVLSSLEVTKRHLAARDGRQADVVKLRLWDKTKALELLARHLGLLVERVSVEADEAVLAVLAAGRRRAAGITPAEPPR